MPNYDGYTLRSRPDTGQEYYRYQDTTPDDNINDVVDNWERDGQRNIGIGQSGHRGWTSVFPVSTYEEALGRVERNPEDPTGNRQYLMDTLQRLIDQGVQPTWSNQQVPSEQLIQSQIASQLNGPPPGVPVDPQAQTPVAPMEEHMEWSPQPQMPVAPVDMQNNNPYNLDLGYQPYSFPMGNNMDQGMDQNTMLNLLTPQSRTGNPYTQGIGSLSENRGSFQQPGYMGYDRNDWGSGFL